MTEPIKRVAVVGTGLIGSSWAALFLAKGLDVSATDVAPGAEAALVRFVDTAWSSLEVLGLAPGASRARLRFTAELEDAVRQADLVQENGPELIGVKRDLFATLDRLLPASTIIASSSSGLTASALQQACAANPERCLIAHPINPPHLIPLVELVGGAVTDEETMQRATAFYQGLGKRTIRLKKEIPGHVANRLSAALWRELVHLVAEDVASVADLDAAVCWGPGLRWGLMGPALLYHLGGGDGGIEHFFRQFAGPMTEWWGTLGTPALSAQLQARIVEGVLAEAAEQSVAMLAARRDHDLLRLLEIRSQSRRDLP